ncbi:MAG TPA: TetR/AcrR family transcriptional regulator [Stellaceae bacterium]|jgi:AcrR family transcriptional regulator|nr:TetR/AcrR family transcriptional regulator [Stellaceae bacterium]
MSVPQRTEPREALGGKAEAILAAAERAFLAGGYGAVSMDAIAREAGVSKATVYAHFSDKEELFGAVIAAVSERFGGFSALELDPRDIECSLITIANRFLALIMSPESIAVNRIIIGEVTRFPVLGAVFWEAGPERVRTQIETFLRRAAEIGSLAIDDARLAAEQFVSLVRGEIHLRRLLRLGPEGDAANLAVAAESAVETFLRAFRPAG